MGAIKAGVSVVTFSEKDSEEALDLALRASNAKGLIIAPDASVGKNLTRASHLHNLMPELSTMYLGDEVKVARFPHLKHVVQTGFKAMRGVNLFKDLTVYASPQYAPKQIPTNSADDIARIHFKNAKVTETTSAELVAHSETMWDLVKDSAKDTHPIFMSADLESTIGFATFLGCSSNFKKIYIPGTYNLSTMLKQVPLQESSWMVCDEDIYGVKAPEGYSDLTTSIKHVIVAGKAGSTELFKNASVKSVDPFTLN